MTGANQFSQNVHFQSSAHSALSNRDLELYELACLSGVGIDPQVFKVLIELLKLDISPSALFSVLQNMAQQNIKPITALKNAQNKAQSSQNQRKKKPPVAAKPKKIRVENKNV